MDCGKQITIEEWCEFSEGVFICLSNCLEGHILFCFPSDLFSYMIHLDVFLRFKCLLVTSLPFFFSMTQVLLLWEIVKLWNTSDLMLLPFCQPKGHSEVFAPWTGRKVGKCALQEDCWAGGGRDRYVQLYQWVDSEVREKSLLQSLKVLRGFCKYIGIPFTKSQIEKSVVLGEQSKDKSIDNEL